MSKLHLICGFLGAGKTTYSQKLAKELHAIHLNPDKWCTKLFTQTEYENNWDTCFAQTIDFLWQKAEQHLILETDVIFDMGFWSKQSRKDAKERAHKLGFTSILYYIYAPDNILKQRIFTRTGAIAQSNLQNFGKLKGLFEEPSVDEEFIKIDNF